MKQLISKSKMVLAIALITTFSFTSLQSFAYKGDTPVEFKYLGNTNDQPVFQLNLNNSESDEFVVTLKNLSGDILYSEKVSGTQISRKYRINTDEIDKEIRVEVTSKKDNSKTVYTVSRNSHVVEDVVINKL